MRSGLYWIEGPWRGRLALAARPRGGDWLEDEIADWQRSGIGAVLSLLTPEEDQDLDLRDEETETRRSGLEFLSFPIPDRHVPRLEARFGEIVEEVNSRLSSGKNVVVHCRQGIGRSGLVAACLLIKNGMSPGAAIDTVSAARGLVVPETSEQRDWIERYAAALTK